MKITTLENCSLQTIVEAFNASFAGYIVPINFTKKTLESKIKTENIMLRFSVGAFDENERLVGFVLHGLDTIEGEKIVYNGGTGVLPEHRGKGLTRQMYRFISPLLEVEDVVKCRLEVIEDNAGAIHNYKKIGFRVIRELECFSGELNIQVPEHLSDIVVKHIAEPNWKVIRSFWNMRPTWQNSIPAMKRSLEQQQFIGLYKDDLLVAYGIIHPKKGRVGQFGVHPDHRGQCLGKLLFHEMNKIETNKLTTINIDRKDEGTIRFLKSIGFGTYIKGQYEMEWLLDGGR